MSQDDYAVPPVPAPIVEDDGYSPPPVVDEYWRNELIGYGETRQPCRAWVWAFACLYPKGDKWRYANIRSNDCVHYLATHKRDYLRFLYENGLRIDAHDRGYGFAMSYAGIDPERVSEEKAWRDWFRPGSPPSWDSPLNRGRRR